MACKTGWVPMSTRSETTKFAPTPRDAAEERRRRIARWEEFRAIPGDWVQVNPIQSAPGHGSGGGGSRPPLVLPRRHRFGEHSSHLDTRTGPDRQDPLRVAKRWIRFTAATAGVIQP